MSQTGVEQQEEQNQQLEVISSAMEGRVDPALYVASVMLLQSR